MFVTILAAVSLPYMYNFIITTSPRQASVARHALLLAVFVAAAAWQILVLFEVEESPADLLLASAPPTPSPPQPPPSRLGSFYEGKEEGLAPSAAQAQVGSALRGLFLRPR